MALVCNACRQGERQCGAGCECRGCTNFSQSQQPDGDGDEDDIENEDEEREGEQDTEPEETDEEWNEEREEGFFQSYLKSKGLQH